MLIKLIRHPIYLGVLVGLIVFLSCWRHSHAVPVASKIQSWDTAAVENNFSTDYTEEEKVHKYDKLIHLLRHIRTFLNIFFYCSGHGLVAIVFIGFSAVYHDEMFME